MCEMTILIVEDSYEFRTMLRIFLEGAGHKVAEAADGLAALERYRESPIDLVITDLIMPHKNGLQLIADLKSEARQVKIVAMSSSDQKLAEARSVGASRTLSKPFSRKQLLDAVAHRGNSYWTPSPSLWPRWIHLPAPVMQHPEIRNGHVGFGLSVEF